MNTFKLFKFIDLRVRLTDYYRMRWMSTTSILMKTDFEDLVQAIHQFQPAKNKTKQKKKSNTKNTAKVFSLRDLT